MSFPAGTNAVGNRPELSIVVPVYNEESGLAAFWARLAPVLGSLASRGEVIFIDDGSSDGTLAQLMSLRHVDPRVRIVSLSRNFGKEIALSAGLDHADGDAVIPIDADLQHPPELIAELVARWRDGNDIVIALRRDRATDGLARRTASRLFHSLFARMTTVPVVRDAGDFRLMSRPVVEALRRLPERTRFMKGLYAWVGFRQTTISYDIEPRREGRSKWSAWHLWRLAIDGITSFSSLPLKVWSVIGLAFALAALTYGSYLIVRTVVRGIDVPGYASVMVVILFLGGLQLLSLGIIGEYLGRVYDEVKARPLYVVRQRIGFDRDEDNG
ncbi:MAG TPA: glycosyltransferase family 2 protein [Casimicrobiaceae bacterium]|jgi:glycosyltransferase involved in cell wall biosynthesis